MEKSVQELADEHYTEEQRKAHTPTPSTLPQKETIHFTTAWRRKKQADKLGLIFDEATQEITAPPLTVHGRIFVKCHMGNISTYRSTVELTDKRGQKFRIKEEDLLAVIQKQEFNARFSKHYYYLTPTPNHD